MADERIPVSISLSPGEVGRLDNLARRFTEGDRSALVGLAIAGWDGARTLRELHEAAGEHPIRDWVKASAPEVDDEPDAGELTPEEVDFLEGVLGPRTPPTNQSSK
jgi:hypothetical protein